MIYTIDKDCNILSINQYFTRLTGSEAKDVIGENIANIIEYKNPDSIFAIIRKVLETSETINYEEQAKIKDQEYWLDTKYQPISAGGGQEGAVLVISRDTTEHKLMETQLFQTEKLASLGSLSAGVAHEMNNPVAIILGFTEILLDRISEGTKEYEILKTIERQGNNCKRIIENLLAFARIPSKTTAETDVVDDLQNVINVVMNTLVTKKIDLRTDIEEDLPPVKGDGQQLEQVFLNIINNAAAAMEGGGILTISAHRSNGKVSVDFSDSGHGIPKEHMERIFEPFFTTKKVGEGTGLGLAVSYGIVTRFGGDIRVTSRTGNKEHGSTISVILNEANATNQESQ
jgi:PAS domain S-box-containing protein